MVLGIYCAGGLGREVYIIAKKINEAERRWDRIVFVDDGEAKEVLGVPVFSFQKAMQEFPDLEIVIASGEPAVRELLYDKIEASGIPAATLIHPGVYIDETTKIGKGCVICEGVTITSCVRIDNNCHIHPHAVIGHDIQIGKHSVIGSNAQIGGHNQIGDRFYLGFLGGTKDELTIGNDVICSAGAIVFRDLPDEVIAVGNPARIVRKNEEKRVFKQ